MTDYLEEQKNEIEALESIYPDEIEICETAPHYVFRLTVTPQESEKTSEEPMSAVIEFTYTSDYPDSVPGIEIVSSENIEDHHIKILNDLMSSEAEENVGMAMIFTIISAVQERMTDLMEKAAQEREEAAERKLMEHEEAERKKFEGTRVTVETFTAWRTKFNAEMSEIKRLKGINDEINKKPTGKALFLSDQSMNDSDVKFLQDEGDTLEVDESLFDLDLDEDLDLDDDDDDPDYTP